MYLFVHPPGRTGFVAKLLFGVGLSLEPCILPGFEKPKLLFLNKLIINFLYNWL